jgi:glycosyltransferase involved in cell wall biosynthesis
MMSLHVDTERTWRGGQNQVLLTVRGLRARGHRATLMAHPDGELRQRAADSGDLILLAPRMELDLTAAWKLSRLLREQQPTIVHAHDAHAVAMTALAISLGGAALPTRLVAARRVTFHVGKNVFSRWKYRQVDRFICASEFIRSVLIGDGIPADRLDVVYDGADLKSVQAAPLVNAHQTFCLPHGAPLVGNVAALDPDKGQRYLVDAAHLVVRRVPDARFLIVGQGELEHTLREQIKHLHLEKHVVLTGFRSDVLSLQKGFDVFAMSSVSEGLGTSALDAMACGRPVVATRVGGLPEVVAHRETGLLVPARDPASLAEAIIELLQDRNLREHCGNAAQERVRERFNADRMIDETVEVYRRVAHTPRVAGSAGPPAAG